MITERDENVFRGYLRQVDVDLEILCNHLKLINCNELKYSNKLNPYYMAKSYLSQRAQACWEDIVSVFRDISNNRLANEVANKHCKTEVSH